MQSGFLTLPSNTLRWCYGCVWAASTGMAVSPVINLSQEVGEKKKKSLIAKMLAVTEGYNLRLLILFKS